MLPRLALILAGVLALSGCSHTSQRPVQTNATLYTIGLSTDPYGNSAPGGFGIVSGLAQGAPNRVELRQRGLGGFNGAEWLDGRMILVPAPAPPFRRSLTFRYDGKLRREGTAPIPGGSGYAWSPGQALFAYEPSISCRREQRSLYACSKASGRLFAVKKDGTGKKEVAAGHLMGWTADGRLAFFKSNQRAIPRAIDLSTGESGEVAPGWKAGLPIWSHDRRYFAAVAGGGVVVAHTDGRIVQTIRSRLTISMIAWAPVGLRLAFTTSGFPDPHQLFVVDRPSARPRLLYVAPGWHFDWITWSPDGKRILLDDENWSRLDDQTRGRWLLLWTDRSGRRRTLPRLGGRPLWCCPVNSYSAAGGSIVRNS